MPEWLWVLFIFLALTVGYLTGFCGGVWKSDGDSVPSENAFIREVEIQSDAYKEIEIRKAELDYQMRMEIYHTEKEQKKGEANGNVL